MRTWPVALCAALLIGVAAFTLSHRRAPVPVTAPAVAVATPATPGQDPDPEPSTIPAPPPEPMPLAVALLPAPGPADANREPAAETDSTAAAGPDALGAQAAARDAALADSAEDFFREASERLEQSPPPAAAALPALTLRHSVAAAIAPTLELPLHAGRASLGWVTQAIRSERQLPSPNAVRLEEILNNFSLRPAGSAAICHGVSITTESLPCPWKPSATLLLISIHGAADAPYDITASFHADPATVACYRLLGFAPLAGLRPGPLPSRLPAKSITTLALEIEPSSTATTFGSLEWTLNGQPAAAIPISHHLATEPSDDARFASLACAFAQWLAHDQPALIDVELLAALVREIASATLPPDRADLLTLVDQALQLEAK
ncbi:MAG: von Willebrand factor type A domain-containing protein [Verrucomicrobiota bacterium]